MGCNTRTSQEVPPPPPPPPPTAPYVHGLATNAPPPLPPRVKWHVVARNGMGCQALSSPPLPGATRRPAEPSVPIGCRAN
ncbi:unnamed protein product [Prunus armeniaca]